MHIVARGTHREALLYSRVRKELDGHPTGREVNWIVITSLRSHPTNTPAIAAAVAIAAVSNTVRITFRLPNRALQEHDYLLKEPPSYFSPDGGKSKYPMSEGRKENKYYIISGSAQVPPIMAGIRNQDTLKYLFSFHHSL